MEEDIGKYIRQITIEGNILYIVKCPLCSRSIIARTYYEARKNGRRHIDSCKRMIEKVMGRA